MGEDRQGNVRGDEQTKLDVSKHDTSGQPEPRDDRERKAPASSRAAEEPAAEQRPPADS